MDWYYKAAIAIAVLWGVGRALGVYGEAARDLDLNFLTGFMLTLGGWAAVFFAIDRAAKFLGWRRTPSAKSEKPGPGAVTVDPPPPAVGPPLRSRQAPSRRRRR